MTDQPRPAVLYGRVSSDEQATNGGGLETQEDFGRRWADLHGQAVVAVYLDTISGTVPMAQRPAGGELLKAAADPKRTFDEVLVYRLDRIGRVPRLVLDAVYALEALGVGVRSLTEPFDTSTPTGRLMLTMLAGFAGFERDSIVARASDGIRRKARAGEWLSGRVAPWGYRVVEGSPPLALDEEIVEALGQPRWQVAQQVLEDLAQGRRTCVQAAEWLNGLGIPTAKGNRWQSEVIAHLCHNPVYRGVHEYGRQGKRGAATEQLAVEVPAIVSEATWGELQEALKRNQRGVTRGRPGAYPLSGILWCARCGASVAGSTMVRYSRQAHGHRGVRYRCNGRLRGECDAPHLPGMIEEMVWELLLAWMRDEPQAGSSQAATPSWAAERAKVEREISEVRAARVRKDEERERIVRLYRSGRLGARDVDVQLDEIQADVRALDDEERQLTARLAPLLRPEDSAQTEAGMREAMRELLRGAVQITDELKAQIIQIAVARVDADTDQNGAPQLTLWGAGSAVPARPKPGPKPRGAT